MKMIPVESSVIRAIGFDAPTRALELQFHTGDVYRFNGVPPRVVEQLRSAPSIGAHFVREVKPRFAGLLVKRGHALGDVIDREPTPGRPAEAVCGRCEGIIVRGSLATMEDARAHAARCPRPKTRAA